MNLSPTVAVFMLAACPVLSAQDRAPVEPTSLPAPDQEVAPVKPAVEKLDATHYRIGDVTINSQTREIRFPAKVNMTEGLIEFLIVNEKGKLHETLLATSISPTHLNLAFTLLRYKASPELYPMPNGTGGVDATRFPEVSEDVKAAARILIDVEWQDQGKTRRLPINDWVQHAVTTKAMTPGPWVYGGAGFTDDGKYIPELAGDIAAIYISLSSMINYPGKDNQDDTVWIPYPKRVPPEGTDVTVVIAPHLKTNSAKP